MSDDVRKEIKQLLVGFYEAQASLLEKEEFLEATALGDASKIRAAAAGSDTTSYADKIATVIEKHYIPRSVVWDYVQPCEENCSKERHAYHQGQWDMADRIDPAQLAGERAA